MSLCNNWSFFFFFKKRKDSYLLLSSDGIFVLTETVWSNTHSSVLWSISNPHVGGKVAARSYRTRFHDKSCQSNKVCQSLIPATTDIFSYWSKKRKSRIGKQIGAGGGGGGVHTKKALVIHPKIAGKTHTHARMLARAHAHTFSRKSRKVTFLPKLQ